VVAAGPAPDAGPGDAHALRGLKFGTLTELGSHTARIRQQCGLSYSLG